jgi:hypothetical protein
VVAVLDRNSSSAESVLLAEAFRDFQKFCALLQVVDIETGVRKPMRLTGIQRAYCRRRTPRDIILKPRKVFMTSLEVARDLWWFLTKRGARVVIVVQSEQGNASRRTIEGMLRVALESLREVVPGVGSSVYGGERFDVETNREFAWHERDATLRIMEAGAAERTARKGGRSQTVNRLHGTEVAFWEHGAATLNSLLNAMPPNGGEAVIETTANGAAGYYHEQYQAAKRGENGLTPHFYTWWLHEGYRTALAPGERIEARDPLEAKLLAAGVAPEAVKWYRGKRALLGQLVHQEFPSDDITCFLVSGRGFFDGESVQRLIDKARPYVSHNWLAGSSGSNPMGGEHAVPPVRVWEVPIAGEEYVVGCDPSNGTGGSAGAAWVIRRSTGRHVATLWGQFRPWVLAKHLVAIAKSYHGAEIAVERNPGGGGVTVLRAIETEQKYGGVMLDHDGQPGLVTSQASRAQMLDTFEEAVRRGAVDTSDLAALGEMRTFVVKLDSGRERAEADAGARDDLVMAGAIAWEAACRRRRPRGSGLGVVL